MRVNALSLLFGAIVVAALEKLRRLFTIAQGPKSTEP
jgi:hypothetical protein